MLKTFQASNSNRVIEGEDSLEAATAFAQETYGTKAVVLTMQLSHEVGHYGADYQVTVGKSRGAVMGQFQLYARPLE